MPVSKNEKSGKNVVLAFNLVHEEDYYHRPIDTMAELDTEETIEGIKKALEGAGHSVIPVEADENAFERLRKSKKNADIIFNIAEGLRGESRESHIPCMAEMLGIPYVGSGPLTLAIALNKYRTKEILLHHGIPTPRYQVFRRFDPGLKTLDRGLRFPLIVKLACEGSCVGMDYSSYVEDESSLQARLSFLFETYDEPVLVEEFIHGREFTIPVLGNDPPCALPIIEVIFFGERPINVFIPDKEFTVFKKLDYAPPVQKTRPECPARISDDLKDTLVRLALKIFTIFECRDWCRMEIRLDENQKPYVLEINPIAGLAPGFWFPSSAEAAGICYCDLINKILDIALARYASNSRI